MGSKWEPSFFGRNLGTDDGSLTPSQKLANKAGVSFFGIDPKYLAEIQKKEIFTLVDHGFSYESLMRMSIEERRYYYHLWVVKNTPND